MKTIFVCLLMFFIVSCKGTKSNEPVILVKQDTIFVVDTTLVSELQNEIEILRDSLEKVTSEITYENYINARRIEKIKYYINITEKNPKNQKFFFGWIKRTMSEE